MKRRIWIAGLAGWVLSAGLLAQEGGLSGEPRGQDRLLQLLIPPDVVMRHQRELGLTAEQRKVLMAVVQEAQGSFTQSMWDLQRELDVLTAMVGEGGRPEADLAEQLDRVLELERDIKRTRFLLALRVRQQLTPEQIAKLEELRPSSRRFGDRTPGGTRRPGPQ